MKWPNFLRFTWFFRQTGYKKPPATTPDKPDLDRVVDWEARKKHLDEFDRKRAEGEK